MKALHVLLRGDKEIRDEVMAQYTYAVPLDQDALLFGACVALAILLLVELFSALVRLAFNKALPSSRPASSNQA